VAVSITAPRGFAAGGGHVGIKPADLADCAIVAATTELPAVAAGVFTQSLAAAAPVVASRAHLAATGGVARAVVLTSGNANAATGRAGLERAEGLCEVVGRAFGAPATEVLIAQTGLIGIPFAFEGCADAVTAVCGSVDDSKQGGTDAAAAMLTTDTRRKEFHRAYDGFTVGAMAKGAAMLAPNMATMLAVLTTDAPCDAVTLRALLHEAVEPTFNRIHVDGATSTNDTVFALSSGLGGAVAPDVLGSALEEACGSLARQMVDDAEGATKTAQVSVTGAASDGEAHAGARKVAGSLLVKCSLNGADPYWGRIVSELGTAGIAFDIDSVSVRYGGITVCSAGIGVAHDEAAVAAHLAGRHIEIACDLGLGTGTASVLCCDLGHGYIDENRGTS
jgi:glutamate N-acetyltransferase/amino-acid N-acetyltransferase